MPSNISLKRQLASAVHKNRLYWRCVANFKPWIVYQFCGRKSLNDVQKRILRDLKRDGIAITTVDKLMRDTSLFKELQTAVWDLEKELSSRINESRLQSKAPGFKTYLVELLGKRPPLDINAIFVRFPLQSVVLTLANSYFGMYTRLRHFNVWHNFHSKTAPRNSQLWHSDPEDRCILKMFVYLTDVDDGAGPLTYAPGTHLYGKIKAKPAYYKEDGTTARRTDDNQMNSVVSTDHWKKAVGPCRTIVFADTSGYHKGGFATEHDRILYTCMFTSRAATRREFFERGLPIPPSPDRIQQFAIGAD